MTTKHIVFELARKKLERIKAHDPRKVMCLEILMVLMLATRDDEPETPMALLGQRLSLESYAENLSGLVNYDYSAAELLDTASKFIEEAEQDAP